MSLGFPWQRRHVSASPAARAGAENAIKLVSSSNFMSASFTPAAIDRRMCNSGAADDVLQQLQTVVVCRLQPREVEKAMRHAIAAAVLVSLCSPARAEGPRLIAVLEFRNREGAKIGDRLAYSARLRTALAKMLRGPRVMTPGEMETLARANPAALDQCNDEDCVSVGRLLGADVVIEGDFVASHGQLTLRLRAVETRGAHQVAQARVVRHTPAELLEGVDAAAGELVDGIAQNLRAAP